MMWFLVLSLGPLMFVTGFSIMNYEETIDNELVQRMRANGREVATTIMDYEKYLQSRRLNYLGDGLLSYLLVTNSISPMNQHLIPTFKSSLVTKLSLFNNEGLLVSSLTHSELESGAGDVQVAKLNGNIYLSDKFKEELDAHGKMMIVDSGDEHNLDLVALTRIEAKNSRSAGYIEEIVSLGPTFLAALKKRLDLEIVLFGSTGEIVASSHDQFLLYDKNFFSKLVSESKESIFELVIKGEPFRVVTTHVKWGNTIFIIGLAASKQRVKAVLRGINYAFFTMLLAIAVLMVLASIVATRLIVNPVQNLVEALTQVEFGEKAVEIAVQSETEIGVLTEAFNEMSRRVFTAKKDLENKVQELEVAYSDLKETQSKLVHSAKMASLGQLVAGVAHELNNPIGYIYSNMSHLREHSQHLIDLVQAADESIEKVNRLKTELDFPYIVEDLPKLIESCEDGARRTRDIVLGLRSFSRLEEAILKRVPLENGIEETLRLLSGEIKNRIKVHTNFGFCPEVLCYPSQLNQVFMNILSNAVQAIDASGDVWIDISVVGSEGQIIHNSDEASSPGVGALRAVVNIRDSGRGMEAETIEKIFDPFFTTKAVGEGTGLGMSISYGIIKKHGGEIEVHSQLGKGTEFKIIIPVDGPSNSEVV